MVLKHNCIPQQPPAPSPSSPRLILLRRQKLGGYDRDVAFHEDPGVACAGVGHGRDSVDPVDDVPSLDDLGEAGIGLVGVVVLDLPARAVYRRVVLDVHVHVRPARTAREADWHGKE